jgi:hypothetical protein
MCPPVLRMPEIETLMDEPLLLEWSEPSCFPSRNSRSNCPRVPTLRRSGNTIKSALHLQAVSGCETAKIALKAVARPRRYLIGLNWCRSDLPCSLR